MLTSYLLDTMLDKIDFQSSLNMITSSPIGNVSKIGKNTYEKMLHQIVCYRLIHTYLCLYAPMISNLKAPNLSSFLHPS